MKIINTMIDTILQYEIIIIIVNIITHKHTFPVKPHALTHTQARTYTHTHTHARTHTRTHASF